MANTSGIPPLANAPIDLSALRDRAKKDLVEILDSVRGKKALILDPTFSAQLSLVTEVALLKSHGVEKMYYLDTEVLNTECTSLIYLVRPKIESMKLIAAQIQEHQRNQEKKEYSIFAVPKMSLICERALEEQGVFSFLSVGDYALDLIPFDNNLISMELESSFKDCFLEKDRTSLFYIAKSLMKVQSMFGIIRNLKAKGNNSKLVVDMLLRMRREMDPEDEPISPEIDQLILIDRDVDMITPLCTQLTYEGLIDEIFGIKNSFIELDLADPSDKTKKKKTKIPLNDGDKLFSEIRDLNFSTVGPLLNRKAKEIDEHYKGRHDAKTVAQIRDYVKKFASAQKEHTSLKIHTTIAEKILNVTRDMSFHRHLEAEQSLLLGVDPSSEYIEECINKKIPLKKVLRLLCLQSLTNNGLKPKQYDIVRREILQTYGFENIFVLNNLEKMGLLKRHESKNTFNTLRKSFNLIVEDISENNPTDIAYVYSGYAPLSCRIIQNSFKQGGWKAKEDSLKLLPGPSVEETQQLFGQPQNDSDVPRNHVTLVFFIGGICYTEIAALKWLSQQGGGELYGDFIIGTTKLITGNSLMDSLSQSFHSSQE